LQKKLEQDLQKLGVQAFVSLGEEVNPDKHEVMTTIPGKTEGVICDEFEK
jgi:molecular chaperone GrpE (heat shock protein)